jgi:Ketopantoate reductase PanE/ApbA
MSEKGRERSFNRAAGITDFRSIALPRRAPVSAMRIAVIGAHGGTYGAALAKAGSDVTFVARGARLAAIRSGLRIKGDRCETHIQAVLATADIAGTGSLITCCCASNCGMTKAPARRFARSLGRKPRSSHCRMGWTPPID